MLELRNVTASYGKHMALQEASLQIRQGEIVVILGANGAGKSTLLKAISGICEGSVQGSAQLNGEELIGLSPDRIVEAGIALVPEGRGVFGELSVLENLLLGAYAERAKDEQEANLDRVMSLFPRLDERRKQHVRTMSGGEQQMVAIGRAMMSSPQILMLDEPSLGLSPLLSKDLFQSLSTVRQSGIGILLVEQNAKASLAISDRGYLLENGQIVHSAAASQLASDPAVQAAYLGGKPKSATPKPKAVEVARPATGPSPNDIAAAALAHFAPPSRPEPAPAPEPAAKPATPVAKTAKPTRPAQQPQAKPAPAAVPIDDLVARAAETSRQAVRSARVPASVKPTGAHTAPPFREEAKTPAMSARSQSSQDRLSQILTEIEEAARRAETWRPSSRS